MMWCSGQWPVPRRSLHPTCLMCGRLVCGPHKQMVQQLDAGPVRRLHDGTPFLRLNPSRMCRRISSPWSLPEQEVTEHPAWAEAETDALIAAVKSAGHMGWPAVRQHLETSGFVRTDAQCQVQWRQIADPLCRMDGLDKMGPQDGTRLRETGDGNVGERWQWRDQAIMAEIQELHSDSERPASQELGGGLIVWTPLLSCYLSSTSICHPPSVLLPDTIQEDFLIGLSAFFRTPMTDRTGLLNKDCSLRLTVLEPVPDRDHSFCKSLAAVMDARAAYLVSRAQSRGCQLEVLWSGGIDSTSLLVAMLRALYPGWRPWNSDTGFEGDKKHHPAGMIVRCSADSIVEYPWFHENVLLPLHEAGAITIEPLADAEEVSKLWEAPSSRMTITGECGDQIFGSQLLEAAFVKSELTALYEHGLDAPWQDTVLHALLDMGIVRPDYKERWLHWFRPFVEKCPLRIVSAFDLLWWLNVACKWQTVCLRLFQRRPRLCWADLDRIVHFFQTEDFQQWSFVPENHAAKMPDHRKWSTYKQPLKEYILDFTQDKEYFEKKLKAGSLCQVNDASRFVILGIDDKLNVLRFGQTCCLPV
ncbi:unnamed protein product [Symbiodinium pilosum]|uniref:Myb-like domain-containing protein n=1 Tax=Symbiodinium pilosum TaxID=2952 RepID=A0A812L7Y3_SYMPI|nr:unnamed protein product [Symbiodinium pilosum]